MRKLIAIVALFFAFTVSTQAQEAKKEANPQALAKEEAHKLQEFLALDGVKTEDFYRLFETKHMRSQDMKTAEDKAQLKTIIAAKIDASLDADQLQRLKANTKLYEDLLN